MRRFRLVFGILLAVVAGLYLAVAALFFFNQRKLEYFPTHAAPAPELTRWTVDGENFGLCREANAPTAVWLIFQGNAGQAGLRGYFNRVAPGNSLYIVDYPGYGQRPGAPTRQSIDGAASAAYRELRRRFPRLPVNVIGESFGSGPACQLAREPQPPDSLLLIVPLARLDLVFGRTLPWLPLRLLLHDNWDNLAALRDYRRAVTIFAAESDEVIPRANTLMLAAAVPQAKVAFTPGGHGQCGENEKVTLPPVIH